MDKMREEFEAWAKNNTNMPLDHNGDYYNKADAYFAYLGWTASRAALKVSVPHVNDSDSAPMLRDYIIGELNDLGISYE